MKNDKISAAIDSVVLSEKDAERIYNKIIRADTHVNCSRKLLIPSLIALIAIVLVAGCVILIGHFWGNNGSYYAVIDNDNDTMSGISIDDGEYTDVFYNEKWMIDHSSDTMLAIAADPSATAFYGLCRYIYDESELKAINENIKLPLYIPDGYNFSSAYVQMYLTEDNVKNAVQIEIPFISEGVVYQCYKFYEDINNNIEELIIVYKNNNGEELKIIISIIDNSRIAGLKSDARSKNVDINGFENSLYTSDRFAKYLIAEKKISPVMVFPKDIIGCSERASMLGCNEISHSGSEYNTINYTVFSVSLDSEELMKIIESIT